MPGRRTILVSACLGAFMATLDTSIVNIALPRIAADFHSSLGQISWVMVIYLLVNVSLLLSSGRLGDMLAPGRLYLLGMLIFTGASVLCGFSNGLHWMVASRALQALGASLMMGLAPKLISLAYGVGGRGLALGLLSTAFAAGISVGAPLGGLITSYLGWPYIFFINVPVCTAALFLGRRSLALLPAAGPWNWKFFDPWGGLTLAGGLGLLLLAVTWLRTGAGYGVWVLAAFGGAVALFILLFFLERSQASPLIHPGLWRSWPFVAGSLTVVLIFAAVMGTFFLLPFLLEEIYRLPPDAAGFLLAALSATNALVAPVGGYLADRLGNLFILRVGSGLTLLGLGSLAAIGPETSIWQLAAHFALLGLGFGLFQAPNLSEILRGVPVSLLGLAASTNSVLKNLGSLLGISLSAGVFSWAGLHHLYLHGSLGGAIGPFHVAFGVAAVVAALNLAVTLLPRRLQDTGS
jgi:EmrB/QacA subfamily drug resistance transporter